MPPPKLVPSQGETYNAEQAPPPFGHHLKNYFGFDPEYVNLNHGARTLALLCAYYFADTKRCRAGSYGSLPLPVSFAAAELSVQIESNPDRFMRITGTPLLDEARSVWSQWCCRCD